MAATKLTFEERVTKVKVSEFQGLGGEGIKMRATSGKGWHTIKQAKKGNFYCTCPSWKFQNHGYLVRHRTCKHLEAAKAKGLIPQDFHLTTEQKGSE